MENLDVIATLLDGKRWEVLTALGAIISALGAIILPIITIAGFLLVIKQLKDAREALETQTREQVYQASLGILNMFIEHPGLRPYFYDRVQLPTHEPERSKVLASCEIMGDHWENILLSKKSLDKETLTVWEDYMVGIYNTSPALAYFFLHEGYRYSDNFLQRLHQELPERSRQQRIQNLCEIPV